MSDNKKKRIVVIGGVAAGTSAASKAKRIDPSADVKIIQEEGVVSYGACGIPYVIEGIVNNFEELVERPPDIFKSKYGIDIIINTRGYKIDRFRKQVHATDLQSGKETIFEYDSLIVATGARAVVPDIKGVNQEGVFLIRNYADGVRINDSKITKSAHSCIIAGAGLIGLEMAEAFNRRGTSGGRMDVTLVERADHVLPTMLDKNMAKTVERELEDNGVRIILGERVEEILGIDGQVSGMKTNTKREINSNFIVLGTGVKPNSEIARDAGVELGSANAIKVDEHMKTNIPDVFAAGDCATARNYITNKDTYFPLGTTANKQGRVAGENAAGGNAKFRGIAGSAITKVFDLFIGKNGLTKEDALRNGFDPVEEVIEDITRARYYPDNKPIWIKIVADRKSGRVLGSQIVGGEGVKERIDLIALALLLRADIRDLASYDACYVPPASPVWEPVNIAASQAAKQL
ncbi:MAG TPA: FAD-dependent oxidoreductase [Candidatus Bathyarchaeia archaeon]|nr:FAD-dependent oxidoreductase [Candidatus Bathyarchaeia archaeon]